MLKLAGRAPTMDKRELKEASARAIMHLTGKKTLPEVLKDLGWTDQAQHTMQAEEAVVLLAKWGIPTYLAGEFAEDWGLGKGITVAKVRAAKNKLTGQWMMTVAKDGKVATCDLKQVLRRIVLDAIKGSKIPPSIEVKLAFDGAHQMTNHKNLQLGTASGLLGHSVEEAMSPANAYIIFMMAAEESEEKYRMGLTDLVKKVEQLLADGAKVDISDEKSVQVNARVVLDFKSLCMFLGYCNIYNANGEYGCLYCHVKRADFAKLQPSTLRTTTEVREIMVGSYRPRRTWATATCLYCSCQTGSFSLPNSRLITCT